MARNQPWKLDEYKHLFGDVYENGQLDGYKTRFKWTSNIIWRDDDTGHSLTSRYLVAFRQAATATKFFGPFYMDCIPTDPMKVPTLKEIQRGYGSLMPAYDTVLQHYLPSRVCVKDGKKCPYLKWYPLCNCAGMGAVFWDGSGGPKTFHKSKPLTPLLARWQILDEQLSLGVRGRLHPWTCTRTPRGRGTRRSTLKNTFSAKAKWSAWWTRTKLGRKGHRP